MALSNIATHSRVSSMSSNCVRTDIYVPAGNPKLESVKGTTVSIIIYKY